MISLNRFDEFGRGMGLPSIRESLSPEPYAGQEEIAEYLDEGKCRMVGGMANDVLNPEKKRICAREFLTDGEFTWWSFIPYYIRTYNLRFPPDVEARLLQKARMKKQQK